MLKKKVEPTKNEIKEKSEVEQDLKEIKETLKTMTELLDKLYKCLPFPKR